LKKEVLGYKVLAAAGWISAAAGFTWALVEHFGK
jgi:hypothetical protein